MKTNSMASSFLLPLLFGIQLGVHCDESAKIPLAGISLTICYVTVHDVDDATSM